MSLSAAALQLLLDKGLTLADAVELAGVIEEGMTAPPPTLDSLARKRSRDAARMREKRNRERQSRDVAATVASDVAPSSRTQVVVLTSSLRSEGTQEANASFVDAPSVASKPASPEKPKTPPPKAVRGTRLPDDWEPSEADIAVARAEGLTDEEISRAALEFRNYWCARSRDAARLSWPRTWHNRIIEIADRKRRNGARLASASTEAGGGGRRATTFADLYVRRHGQASDREPVSG